MIYLDNAATTFPKPECVYAALDKANRTLAFNAGRGAYKAAHQASAIIDEVKTSVAELFNAKGIAEVVCTPSVTHAFNQILNGLDLSEDSIIYVSPYEHNAVARTVNALERKIQSSTVLLPLNEDLSIDLEKTEFLFETRRPSVVILNALSNVTGYVAPVQEVFALAKNAGAITVLDAAQAAGLIPIDMEAIQADVICFAGHKTLMGPLGAAGFVIRNGITLRPVLTGGTGTDSLNLDMPAAAPGRYEASSANIPALAGLLAALKCLDVEEHYHHVKDLTEYLLGRLTELPKVSVLATPGNVLGIVSFVVEGYNSDEVGSIFDEEFDIAVRTGYHCAPYIHTYLNDKPMNGTIRVGLGMFNTRDDIDVLVNALESL